MTPRITRSVLVLTALAVPVLLAATRIQGSNIADAILGEPGQRTAEVSTGELTRILAERSAIVLDARPHLEYAISHIPGALNVAAKPNVAASMYISDVAEVGRLVNDNKAAPIVLYCNGPHCGKSKRLADELLAAGFTSIRRYQLGIPVWRALGGVTEIDADGLRHVLANDRTAVVVDARDSTAFRAGTISNARHIPRSGVLDGKDVGEVRRAKDDGRLPMNDHNTRIIVIGSTVQDSRYVAEALAREAFHNVAFYRGTASEALAAARQ
ncbi:MAG TPA: rhodanese-like domain-containing protein [Gemmatimonadaceae bacterium]|nr:rhodanese-like domain-containing protein [Gemmatimonadaceae bacterium]